MLAAMYRALLALVVIVGCGRIGFDPPTPTGDGGRGASDGPRAPDGSADANLVCPATQPSCELCGNLVASCTYGTVCCGCTGAWNCSSPNDAACPAAPPMIGAPCAAQVGCTYCPFQEFACDGAEWVAASSC